VAAGLGNSDAPHLHFQVDASRLPTPGATLLDGRQVLPGSCRAHFPHHDRFADGFATARDAEAEPDAEGREEGGDERAVELNGVLDDDEAVFGVLEGSDEEGADETGMRTWRFMMGCEEVYRGTDQYTPICLRSRRS